ncbi:MAG: hypothetical protein ACRD23_09630 [Terriglobales bacterium]
MSSFSLNEVLTNTGTPMRSQRRLCRWMTAGHDTRCRVEEIGLDHEWQHVVDSTKSRVALETADDLAVGDLVRSPIHQLLFGERVVVDAGVIESLEFLSKILPLVM